MAAPLVIFLRSADWESRYLAVTLAVTAAAMGDEVHLALHFGALRALLDGRFDEGAPAGASAAGIPPLSETLEEGRRALGVKVVACDTALRLSGAADARDGRLDGVVSLPSLWRLAQRGRTLSF